MALLRSRAPGLGRGEDEEEGERVRPGPSLGGPQRALILLRPLRPPELLRDPPEKCSCSSKSFDPCETAVSINQKYSNLATIPAISIGSTQRVMSGLCRLEPQVFGDYNCQQLMELFNYVTEQGKNQLCHLILIIAGKDEGRTDVHAHANVGTRDLCVYTQCGPRMTA